MPPATRRRHQPQPEPEAPLDPPSDLDDVSHDDPASGYMESVMADIYAEAEDDEDEAPPGRYTPLRSLILLSYLVADEK